MSLMQDAPNVVSEEGLRTLLGEGYTAEVVCRTEPIRRAAAQWAGLWTIHCVAPDGASRRLLVTARNTMAEREFKTINGLVSFLVGLGLKVVSIPMEEGGVASHALEQNKT